MPLKAIQKAIQKAIRKASEVYLNSIYEFEKMFNKIEGLKVALDQSMSLHTTFKVGGPADILVIPNSEQAFISALNICKLENIPVFVMGNGSNLLVRDKGIRGVVIKLAGGLNEIKIDGNILTAQAGALLSKLAKFAAKHALSGLEFAEGIPGTVGGAVAMNAGAYNGEMKNVVQKSICINSNGIIKELNNEEHEFGYRKSVIKTQGLYVVKIELALNPLEYDIIVEKMKEFSKLRTEKQPLNYPSAGSTFKRPQGYYAGKLIEECGLKGCNVGGAQVSTKHSGFIVNSGGAKAEDVIQLICLIQDRVMIEKGVKMETEIMIIGEN